MHDFCESVLIISRALGHKQGTKIERVVLNRVCILGIFCPKLGQGFKPSAAQLYSNIGRVPPPPPGLRADALETSVMFLNHKSRLLMCGWNKSAASLWLLE